MPFYHKTLMLSKLQPQTFKCTAESTRKYQGSQKSSVPRTSLGVWGGGGFSCHGGEEASSVIYPNAQNSSVMCRCKNTTCNRTRLLSNFHVIYWCYYEKHLWGLCRHNLYKQVKYVLINGINLFFIFHWPKLFHVFCLFYYFLFLLLSKRSTFQAYHILLET